MSEAEVRVRLTAEGVAEVVAALRKVQAEAKLSSVGAARSFGGLNAVLGSVKTALRELVPVLAVGAMVDFARRSSEAADQVGKAAQAVGASVRNFSALTYGARQANVPLEALETSMARFARNTTAAVNGSKTAQAVFGQLGISARDLRGKDTAEQLDLIAKAFGRLKDSPAKTALAMDVFGKAGAQMIPLLNELSEVGLKGLIRSASELGIILSEKVVAGTTAVNDNMATLGIQAQAMAAKFVSGASAPIVDAMKAMEKQLGRMGHGFELFGTGLGYLLRGVFYPLVIVLDTIYTTMQGIWKLAVAAKEAGEKLLAKDVAGANDRWKQATSETAQLNIDLARRSAKNFESIFSPAPPIKLPKRKAIASPEGNSDDASQKAQRKEALRQQVLAMWYRVQEAQGQSHAATMLRIDEEVAKYQQILRDQGRSKEEAAQMAHEARAALRNKAQFDALLKQAREAMQALDDDRKRIQSDVHAGFITEAQGQEQIARIERERLPKLQAIAKAVEDAAAATQDENAQVQARQNRDSLRNLGLEARRTGQAFEFARGPLEDFFATGISQAQSFRQTLADLVLALAQAFQRMVAMKIVGAVFGTGFSKGGRASARSGRAAGGFVTGPGTPTSDSIPAWLSAGEYVVRASAVARPGVLEYLEEINRGMQSVSVRPYRSGSARFADGGFVGAATQGVSGTIHVALDDGLILQKLESPEGQRVQLKNAGRARRAYRNILGS